MRACSAAGWGAYLSLYFQMAKVELYEVGGIGARGRAGAAIRPGPSWKFCALTLSSPERFYALPPVRYL
jgi:hypothetical protein